MNNMTLPRPRTRADLPAWYQSILDQQASSSLSLKAFAVEQGIPLQNLYSWRRRLAKRTGAADSTPSVARELPGFIELELPADPTSQTKSMERPFVLRLSDGRSLEIPPGFDPGEVQTLLALAQSC